MDRPRPLGAANRLNDEERPVVEPVAAPVVQAAEVAQPSVALEPATPFIASTQAPGEELIVARPPLAEAVESAPNSRGFDLLVALSLLLLVLPLMLFCALAVWVSGRGPLLYRQRRIGLGGRPFTCLKFRTMVDGADRRIDDVLRQSRRSEKEWLAIRKLQSDPRVTPTGRFLRRYCLDELPQLFNVIAGDMSVVGPRPIVAGEVPRYGLSFADYCSVKPGITGLWQVSGRHSLTYAQRVQIDACYARTRSTRLDLKILLRTIPILLRGDNV